MLKPLLTGWCSSPTVLRPFARHDQHNPVHQTNLARNIIMENPIKIDDLGVPLFLETPIY